MGASWSLDVPRSRVGTPQPRTIRPRGGRIACRSSMGRAPRVTDRTTDDTGDADKPAWMLDDDDDRDELRNRYYTLLQELRVVLPGVQVLAAFLLTVPFAQRFAVLDATGKTLFAVSLVSASLSVI